MSGLQCARLASIIQEGEAGEEAGIETYTMPLAEGVRVQIRTGEFVNPDGTVGFQPDIIVPQASAKDSDPWRNQLL